MRILLLSSFLALPTLSGAFMAPQQKQSVDRYSTSSKILPKSQYILIDEQLQRKSAALFDQMGIGEKNAPTTDDVSLPTVVTDAATTAAPENNMFDTGSEGDDDDVGRAIFLSKVQENAELLKVVSQENDVVDPNLSLSDALNNMQQHEDDAVVVAPLSTAMDESVNAVLAASEEAALAAEATLNAGLVETSALADDDETAAKISVTTPSIQPTVDVVLQTDKDNNGITSSGAVVTTEQDTTTTAIPPSPTAPSVAKILKFAVPAVGVWLCSPLLSLIDTSAVGILSGTVQQAALNPAVAVTDYAALLIAFMYTGTTNLIAAATEKDRGTSDHPRTSKTLIGVLQLSTFVGAGLGAILFVFARTLLRTIIGNDGISPAVFDAALKYVRIRALGMPAAAMIGSAQAACLGMQDIRSPLYVLLAAAIVNFFGDVLFVGCTHPWIGGAAGAAWATVFSQYAAVGLFVHWLCHKGTAAASKKHNDDKPVNLSNAILELTGKPSTKNERRRERFVNAVKSLRTVRSTTTETTDTEKNGVSIEPKPKAATAGLFARFRRNSDDKKNAPHSQEKPFTVRGFLEGKLRKRELVKLPPNQTLKDFAPYLVPVTSTQVGRVSGYVAMSHVVSSSLGTVSMAAQQVIVSLFYCLCPIADSLSLTAQSFLPAISEKKASPERSRTLRQTMANFVKAGGVFGAVMMAAVSCIPLLSGFFTADPFVVSLVNMVTPLLMGIFAVHGFVCVTEGLLLGQKDLGFLGKMYAGFFAIVPYFMLRVKRAALADTTGRINLTSVWKVFLSYQLFRFVAWGARVAMIQRRTEKEAPVSTTTP